MTPRGPTPGQLARYLRQLRELSGSHLFLDQLTAEEALKLAVLRSHAPATTSKPSDLHGSSADAVASQEHLASDYEELKAHALSCRRCSLAETRTQVVFSDGSPGARLVVVGEAPGAREDKTGKAFVGPAGKYLDLLLACVGLSREDSVYICNVLKCRPPGNRNPLPAEIQACTPYLRRQLELISPRALLAVGSFAAQFLTGRESPLGQLRGEVYSYQGVPVVVTYHPAALLRNSVYTRPTWDDLQLLRQVMDEA